MEHAAVVDKQTLQSVGTQFNYWIGLCVEKQTQVDALTNQVADLQAKLKKKEHKDNDKK